MKSIAYCASLLTLLLAFSVGVSLAATVNVDGTHAGDAYGNSADGSGAFNDVMPTGNTLNINSGGTVTGDAYGAMHMNPQDPVTGNSVFINNGGFVTGNVFGGRAHNNVGLSNGNIVTINGGSVGGNVFGGYSGATASVTDNSVVINGGSVGGNVFGGYSSLSESTGNSVVINGGSTGAVYGGYSDGNALHLVTGNSATISGGTVNGNIYGGYRGLGGGTATHNTVSLSGTPNLSSSTIYGGDGAGGGGGGDFFTGNTLNVRGFSGPVVGLVNFQNYNFLPSPFFAPGMTQIQITGANAVDLNNTNVTFNGGRIAANGMAFVPGQSVKLIDKVQGSPATMSVGNPVVRQGIAMMYTFDLALRDNALVAVATGAQVAPEAKALAEGHLGSLVFVNQGADLVAGKGMEAAQKTRNEGGSGLGAFAAVSGGWSKYNTGSHVDVAGASLIAGLAWNPAIEYGRFTLGAFFEAGWGGYNTHNSFSGMDANGNGNTRYYGGGLLARYELPCGFYTEASGRIGGVQNEYDNSDLRDPLTNRKASYDLNSTYYGAHAGLGYIWAFNEKAKLDIHAKYLWTHMTGGSVHAADDPIKFKDTDSHRVRGGARFTYAINEYVVPYIGAAWEWEFDGRARAATYGYNISTPDVTGGTGIGELGLSVKPFAKSAGAASGLSFDLAVQGYAGVRQGVTGSFQAKWEF